PLLTTNKQDLPCTISRSMGNCLPNQLAEIFNVLLAQLHFSSSHILLQPVDLRSPRNWESALSNQPSQTKLSNSNPSLVRLSLEFIDKLNVLFEIFLRVSWHVETGITRIEIGAGTNFSGENTTGERRI